MRRKKRRIRMRREGASALPRARNRDLPAAPRPEGLGPRPRV